MASRHNLSKEIMLDTDKQVCSCNVSSDSKQNFATEMARLTGIRLKKDTRSNEIRQLASSSIYLCPNKLDL